METGQVYRRCVVASRPSGRLVAEDFRVETVERPRPAEGEFGIAVEYITVSPPAVVWMSTGGATAPIPIGDVMRGTGIGRVTGSRHPAFQDGDVVIGQLGWSEYAISDGGSRTPVQKFVPPPGVPLTTGLHVLGATGATAFFALYDIGQPRLADRVLVSAAAGSVGSVVCQLARMAGCTVVAVAGSDRKCAWLRDELGVSATINYKTESVEERVRALCPEGIDIYFDNVGGSLLDVALSNLRPDARVVICGSTSQYDGGAPWVGPASYFALVHRQATMKGFHISQYAYRMEEATGRLAPLLGAGQLKYAEDMLEGIENAPMALVRVLAGENFGTQLVKLGRE